MQSQWLFTSFEDNHLLGKRDLVINSTTWEDQDLYFEISARQDSLLQVVDLFQSRAGDLQIRNLVVAEQVRQPRNGGAGIFRQVILHALIHSDN